MQPTKARPHTRQVNASSPRWRHNLRYLATEFQLTLRTKSTPLRPKSLCGMRIQSSQDVPGFECRCVMAACPVFSKSRSPTLTSRVVMSPFDQRIRRSSRYGSTISSRSTTGAQHKVASRPKRRPARRPVAEVSISHPSQSDQSSSRPSRSGRNRVQFSRSGSPPMSERAPFQRSKAAPSRLRSGASRLSNLSLKAIASAHVIGTVGSS